MEAYVMKKETTVWEKRQRKGERIGGEGRGRDE